MLSASRPFSLLLFGASGNLAKLKLYPALYTLALKKRLPSQYAIVGFSRTEMSDDAFRTFVADAIRSDMLEVTESALEEFLSHVSYCAGQYDSADDMKRLKAKLETMEKEWGKTVRLAYLSIPPQVMTATLKGLCAAQIRGEDGEFRCIVEKPVGHDMKSFEEIRDQLTHCLKEEEIFLLDHYLGKEAVRNVYYLRFANPILERLFKNTLIHHIEITASETVGIEGRASYFDHTGTLRDMIQSHLIQLCSLLTMRLADSENAVPAGRLDAQKLLYLPPAASLDDVIIQGQYGAGVVGKENAKGYREEEGVAHESRTNTFVALKLHSREPRWQGVPFYLRSGKRLAKKETRVSIRFQEPRIVGQGSNPNRLDIILQGEAGMRLSLQTKLGGTEPAFRPLILADPLVCIGDCLPEHGLLILEAIAGKRNWFLSFEEVRSAWRFIDPLQAYLDQPTTPLHTYASGEATPEAAHRWIERDGLPWF